MVTAIIGRRFLEQYNLKRGSSLNAKEFFETIYFPLFYNHPKYMQWIGNSPFVQMKKGQKPNLLTQSERLEKLGNLTLKIRKGEIDASTAIGYPASEISEFATTSGQVTNLNLERDEDTVYCSWIGSGFGIGIGGITVLFDHPDILNTIFEGWQHYRDDLNDPAYSGIPGNKINGWNAHWLVHAFGTKFRFEDPRFGFPPPFEAVKDPEELSIKRLYWVKLIFAIAKKLPIGIIVGYLYHYDKTNKTYGFIPFDLRMIKRPQELYVKLFGNYAYQRDAEKIELLYGSAHSFQTACQRGGAIGISALEPKELRNYISSTRREAKDFSNDLFTENNQFTFNTYISWLLAMLNNDEFWDEAGRAADLLLQYETTTKRQKDLGTLRINQVENLLNATGKRQFLEALVPVMENANTELLAGLEEFAKKVHKLPNDNFPYFHTLVKLRYAKQSRESMLNSTLNK